MGVRHDEKACCEELPIWSGYNLSTPAFMEPITRRVKFSCTPRVCNSFNLPYFNIGTKDHPKWIQVGRAGDIIEARDPQEFVPISTNKKDQIVLKQGGIYSKKQEEEFRRFNLMRDARDLIQNELFLKMFSESNLAAWIRLRKVTTNFLALAVVSTPSTTGLGRPLRVDDSYSSIN